MSLVCIGDDDGGGDERRARLSPQAALPPPLSGGDYASTPLDPLPSEGRAKGRYRTPTPPICPFSDTWMYASLLRFHVPPADILALADFWDGLVQESAKKARRLCDALTKRRRDEAAENRAFNERNVEPGLRAVEADRKAAAEALRTFRLNKERELAAERRAALVPAAAARPPALSPAAIAAREGKRLEEVSAPTAWERAWERFLQATLGSVIGWSFLAQQDLVSLDSLWASPPANVALGAAVGMAIVHYTGKAVRSLFRTASEARTLGDLAEFSASLRLAFGVAALALFGDVAITGAAFMGARDLADSVAALSLGPSAPASGVPVAMYVASTAFFSGFVVSKAVEGWRDDRAVVLNMVCLKSEEPAERAKSDAERLLDLELAQAERQAVRDEAALNARAAAAEKRRLPTDDRLTEADRREIHEAVVEVRGHLSDYLALQRPILKRISWSGRWGRFG